MKFASCSSTQTEISSLFKFQVVLILTFRLYKRIVSSIDANNNPLKPWILRLLGVSFDTLFYECRVVHSKTVFVQKVQNFFGGFPDIS